MFPAPMFLAEESLGLLEPVKAYVLYRKGRRLLLYHDRDLSYPSENITALRTSLATPQIEPKGRREEKEAYFFARDKMTPLIDKLAKAALEYVGATLRIITQNSEGLFQVSYVYRGRVDVVLIDRDLTVVSSGICLSGRDADYDLGSAVLIKANR